MSARLGGEYIPVSNEDMLKIIPQLAGSEPLHKKGKIKMNYKAMLFFNNLRNSIEEMKDVLHTFQFALNRTCDEHEYSSVDPCLLRKLDSRVDEVIFDFDNFCTMNKIKEVE